MFSYRTEEEYIDEDMIQQENIESRELNESRKIEQFWVKKADYDIIQDDFIKIIHNDLNKIQSHKMIFLLLMIKCSY